MPELTSHRRCIRCGDDTDHGLYCPQCYTMEWAKAVHEVDVKGITPEWVRRRNRNALPAKEFQV